MTFAQKSARLAGIKREMVAAHRAGDGERLRELSAEKQALKKIRHCIWPECGVRINAGARHCIGHDKSRRHYSHALDDVQSRVEGRGSKARRTAALDPRPSTLD